MAARRLIIIMVVLLGISTIAAAFAPVREEEKPATPPRTERPQPDDDGGEGSDIKRVKVRVNNRPSPTIRVEPGQELILSISSRFGDDVEIPALGLVETMSPLAPAVFDLYLDEPTAFGISTVGSERLVAKVVVSDEPATSAGAAGGGAQRVERGVPAGPDPQ